MFNSDKWTLRNNPLHHEDRVHTVLLRRARNTAQLMIKFAYQEDQSGLRNSTATSTHNKSGQRKLDQANEIIDWIAGIAFSCSRTVFQRYALRVVQERIVSGATRYWTHAAFSIKIDWGEHEVCLHLDAERVFFENSQKAPRRRTIWKMKNGAELNVKRVGEGRVVECVLPADVNPAPREWWHPAIHRFQVMLQDNDELFGVCWFAKSFLSSYTGKRSWHGWLVQWRLMMIVSVLWYHVFHISSCRLEGGNVKRTNSWVCTSVVFGSFVCLEEDVGCGTVEIICIIWISNN